jgi:hypothetical protein
MAMLALAIIFLSKLSVPESKRGNLNDSAQAPAIDPDLLAQKQTPKTEKPALAVKVSTTSCSISDDAKVKINIVGLPTSPAVILTEEMLSNAKLEWSWVDIKQSSKTDESPEIKLAMSPHYGSVWCDSKKERGPRVNFPIAVDFDVKSVFIDSVSEVIHPGEYDVRVAIPIIGHVLYSEYFKLTLTSPGNCDVRVPPIKCELEVSFNSKMYEIKAGADIQVTIKSVNIEKNKLALTRAMLDCANLEWKWVDKNNPKNTHSGGYAYSSGNGLKSEIVHLPVKVTLPLEKALGRMLNLEKPRDPKLQPGERDPNIFDYTVLPGFYDVNLVIFTGKDVYRSAPTRIEVVDVKSSEIEAPKAK